MGYEGGPFDRSDQDRWDMFGRILEPLASQVSEVVHVGSLLCDSDHQERCDMFRGILELLAAQVREVHTLGHFTSASMFWSAGTCVAASLSP